jgi:hypothetical protein
MSDSVKKIASQQAIVKNLSNIYSKNDFKNGFIDMEHDMMHGLGKRRVRQLKVQTNSQDYYRTKDIHAELFDHYENTDWYVRDGKYDFMNAVKKLEKK